MLYSGKSEESVISTEQYVANAVHEIRTPVQTIIGTLDLLSDTKLNKEQAEYVRQIRFGSDVLLAIVNDILDFSKIKSNKMKLENVPYDVKTLTENVVHLISIEAFNKKVEIVTDVDYSIPDLVLGDPTRVQQILMNLLKNAVKFTDQGYIHAELMQKDGKLLFKITDSGIGIPKEKRECLFEAYAQGDASISRKYGGTGLGLPICRGLVHNMNGEIGVEPNPFGGSCFWFTIPLHGLSDDGQKQYELPVPATTRILIVDDSSMAVKSLERQLNSIGLQYIQHSTDGEDAYLKMTYAEKIGNPFDIVFIDMIMPVIEGWHLASNIKGNPKLANAKLYMLVPEGQMGRDAKLKLLDWFTGYLYKPVRMAKLDQLLISTNQSRSFFDILEKADETKPEEAVKKAEQQIAEGIKVLVAEDHPVNSRIITEFLKKYGATVIEATNGQETVEIVRKDPEIKIIFMDIQMPVLSGIDATRQLRKEHYNGIIVACTANNDPANFSEYQRIGMNDILIKPFKRDGVKTILEKWNSVINLPFATEITSLDSDMILNEELWDMEDFEDTIGNDVDLGKQIILDYIDQTRHFLNAAYDLLDNKDFFELQRVAHTLKGSSAAISANRLAAIAAQMSSATKEKSPEKFHTALNNFEEYFEFFILATNKWRHILN